MCDQVLEIHQQSIQTNKGVVLQHYLKAVCHPVLTPMRPLIGQLLASQQETGRKEFEDPWMVIGSSQAEKKNKGFNADEHCRKKKEEEMSGNRLLNEKCCFDGHILGSH